MYAVFCRWLETVRELLKSGANLETTDGDGMTPFLMACADGSVDIARLLLDAGANIHAASKFDGQRALQYASFEGNLAIVQELILRGHDIDAANDDGRTSLAFAAYKGQQQLFSICELRIFFLRIIRIPRHMQGVTSTWCQRQSRKFAGPVCVRLGG